MERLNSIQTRLTKGMLLTSGVVLLLAFASYFVYEVFSYRAIVRRQVNVIGDIVASNSTAALAFRSNEEAAEILSGFQADRNIRLACIFDSDGELFATYPDSLPAARFPEGPGDEGVEIGPQSIAGFIPIVQRGKRLGTLYIERGTADISTTILLYLLIALVIISVSFLFAVVLSRRLQREITRPIIALSEATRLVTRYHDYSVRAQKISNDETGILTDAFNKMLAQIEIQNQQIRAAQEAAHLHAIELEVKVNERTIEYKREKEFAQAVVNSSLVMIAVFDRELNILEFNRRCEEEFGLSRQSVLGRGLSDAMNLGPGSVTHESIVRALAGETVHNPSYKSPITGNFYESFVVPLYNEKNEVYAALLTAHNITELITASERIRENNIELRRKNSDLEQFAYVASHDLQEPLRKIQTFMELTRANFDDQATADRYMTKIESSAARMSALIKDVLEYSRLTTVGESFTLVDLNVVLENVKTDFELVISDKKARIDSATLPVIRAHRLQMQQLFTNLLSNSLKFSTVQPYIRVSAFSSSPEEIGRIQHLDSALNYVGVQFEDNGIGFEQQFADKVFTIFQRLNTREKYEGTGIGLALCKKIVENHRGHIQVVSQPGKGTTFTIYLPSDHSTLFSEHQV